MTPIGRWLLVVVAATPACARSSTIAAPQSEPSTAPAATPGAPPTVVTASGLRIAIVAGNGPGEPAGPGDRAVLRYVLRDASGATVDRTPGDTAATKAMTDLPPSWAEAIALMVPGDTATVWIPTSDPQGTAATTAPRAATLELALVDVLRGADLQVSSPPPDAARTASGIAYVVIKAGTGTQHPPAGAQLTAHYAGWTTDGKPFDSSYERGEPIEFKASQVIKGWGEAVALMVVGEKTRFWIPQELAYQGKAGRPFGMLVFDIELLGFTPQP